MSLLDGGLASIIGEAFSSGEMRFLSATRHRTTLSRSPGGDTTSTPTDLPCLAMVDRCTEDMRRADGYTDQDMRIIILGTSINSVGATVNDLTTDDEVTVNEGSYRGVRWSIASVDIDPAGATVTTRGQRA